MRQLGTAWDGVALEVIVFDGSRSMLVEDGERIQSPALDGDLVFMTPSLARHAAWDRSKERMELSWQMKNLSPQEIQWKTYP